MIHETHHVHEWVGSAFRGYEAGRTPSRPHHKQKARHPEARTAFVRAEGPLPLSRSLYSTPSIQKPFANDESERYNRSALRENFKGGFVYILAGKSGVLYVGVTTNLYMRVVQHRQKLIEGFTKKYNITRLVHYEQFADIRDAIAREKQLKGWLRRRKIALIESTNPTWRDLFDDFLAPQQTKTPSS